MCGPVIREHKYVGSWHAVQRARSRGGGGGGGGELAAHVADDPALAVLQLQQLGFSTG